jgi:uncharacterized protein (TIGR00369 family)
MNEQLNKIPPGASLLGRKLISTDVEAGRIELSFMGKPEFTNRHGTIQGGFLAAMLDATTGLAVLSVLPDAETAVTLDLNVSYLHPCTVGPILATGTMTHRSRSIARSNGELRAEDGTVVATATASLRIIKQQRD